MAEGTQRRLAAIVSVDVVGYSRLMGVDETGTLAALREHREDLIDALIAEHGGRIVKTMGDGLLLEFPSVVEATQSMVEIQSGMAERNLGVDEGRRIIFRIGINLGDIIIEGEDILGDGVNIAARLQEIAEPGGVAISGRVHDDVRDRLDAGFVDTGEQALKNIARPVRVWQWSPTAPAPTDPQSTDAPLAPPDKPSIAVLPFDNISGDPEQEYLADGIAEDLLTNLSQVHELFVIARNSSFSYKGQHPDLRKVSMELGVRYILEGSVRKAGNRVRVTAQLIDGTNGSHLWAERYDRDLEDIFELQDEITSKIATAMQVRLTEGQQVNFRRNQTTSFPAWQSYQQALYHVRRFSRGDNVMARELLQAALQDDPVFVSAMSLLAWTYVMETRLPWGSSTDAAIDQGLAIIDKAMAITDKNPDVFAMLGSFRIAQEAYDGAEEALLRAIALGPNVADIHVTYALLLNLRNRPVEAVAMIENAMRLCPIYPDWYLGILAMSYRLLERYDDAIEADLERVRMNSNNIFSDIRLAAVYAQIGEMDKAKHRVDEALKKQPNYRVSNLSETDRYEDPVLMRQYEDLLRKAGLPEE